MHEFALAQDIVKTITKQVTDDLGKITGINIEIGAFSGVVADSLEFGIQVVFAEKKLPEVNVNIVKIATIALCACGKEYELNEIFEGCPGCGSFERKILSGADIMINSVELSEN
jgi:hydrogenase nickel incorporation protein HypA/HybF